MPELHVSEGLGLRILGLHVCMLMFACMHKSKSTGFCRVFYEDLLL